MGAGAEVNDSNIGNIRRAGNGRCIAEASIVCSTNYFVEFEEAVGL